jgi:hypothetical protein
MEAICSSETSVYFQQTTRRYIPEDRTLQWYYINFVLFKEHQLIHRTMFSVKSCANMTKDRETVPINPHSTDLIIVLQTQFCKRDTNDGTRSDQHFVSIQTFM